MNEQVGRSAPSIWFPARLNFKVQSSNKSNVRYWVWWWWYDEWTSRLFSTIDLISRSTELQSPVEPQIECTVLSLVMMIWWMNKSVVQHPRSDFRLDRKFQALRKKNGDIGFDRFVSKSRYATSKALWELLSERCRDDCCRKLCMGGIPYEHEMKHFYPLEGGVSFTELQRFAEVWQRHMASCLWWCHLI